jgi:hypothetical protein
MLIGMAASSSRGLRGKAPVIDGQADWGRNYCFLPPWHEWPKCTCRHPCTIDMWEWDGINGAGRCYFKCADIDLNFMVWW